MNIITWAGQFDSCKERLMKWFLTNLCAAKRKTRLRRLKLELHVPQGRENITGKSYWQLVQWRLSLICFLFIQSFKFLYIFYLLFLVQFSISNLLPIKQTCFAKQRGKSFNFYFWFYLWQHFCRLPLVYDLGLEEDLFPWQMRENEINSYRVTAWILPLPNLSEALQSSVLSCSMWPPVRLF